jgi:hypothetical protein
VNTHVSHETFSLSPEDKQRLLESIAEADRGEFVDADELLAELEAEERRPPVGHRKSR